MVDNKNIDHLVENQIKLYESRIREHDIRDQPVIKEVRKSTTSKSDLSLIWTMRMGSESRLGFIIIHVNK